MIRVPTIGLLLLTLAAPAWAINGNGLPLNSGGTTGSSALLNNNGYAGTYVTLDNDGPLTISVNAQGTAFGGIDPRMNISVGDEIFGWDVGSSATNYEHTFDLPAGTYFVRTEFNNDRNTTRSLRINTLDVSGSGVTAQPFNLDILAQAAAQTYIDKFRQGPMKLALSGVAPGTQVDVTLKRHAFNFGVAVPNSFTDTLLIPNPAPGSDAARFQEALVDNRLNSLTAGNGGKWDANEGSRDVLTQHPTGGYVYMDRIADYAAAHDMGYRAHNVIWGQGYNSNNNSQQPSWVNAMLNNPMGMDTYNAGSNPHGSNLSNKDALFSDLLATSANNLNEKSEIHERIDYYVKNRATQFYEIDVYNESVHTGANNPGSSTTYWDHYGASGVAKMYKLVNDAIQDGGGDAGAFVNEWGVLQGVFSDYYANWYARHIEEIQNAGKDAYGESENVVTGIGFQYYPDANLAGHVPARIYATMQNLAVQGLPMTLTEWGVGVNDPNTGDVDKEAIAATILEETARLVFGMPGVNGMTLWEMRTTGAFAPIGALHDSNWDERDTAIEWKDLQDEWHTEYVNLPVAADGTIDFTGFYGDYEITIGGTTYDLVLAKGDTLQSIVIAPGDYNGDLIVDAADYTVWRNSLDIPGDLRADGNGDELINADDYDVWLAHYGDVYLPPGGGGMAGVPEPASAVLLVAGIAGGMLRRRGRNRRAL